MSVFVLVSVSGFNEAVDFMLLDLPRLWWKKICLFINCHISACWWLYVNLSVRKKTLVWSYMPWFLFLLVFLSNLSVGTPFSNVISDLQSSCTTWNLMIDFVNSENHSCKQVNNHSYTAVNKRCKDMNTLNIMFLIVIDSVVGWLKVIFKQWDKMTIATF